MASHSSRARLPCTMASAPRRMIVAAALRAASKRDSFWYLHSSLIPFSTQKISYASASGREGRKKGNTGLDAKWTKKGLPGPEERFKHILAHQSKVEILFRLRELLMKEPEQVIQMDDLGKMRRELGIVSKTRKVPTLVQKFPSVFQSYRDEDDKTWCGFTADAEKLFEEEKQVLENCKLELVSKLRKLLMMSVNNRMLVNKIAHMRKYFGLPSDFQTSLLEKYPEYFRLEEVDGRLYVELTSWDSSLAITALEKRAQKERLEHGKGNGIQIRFPLIFKKGFIPRKKRLDEIEKLQIAPYLSPYNNSADFELKEGTLEAEKFAVGVIHELLSLTIEKRTVVEQLGQFRQEYRLLIPRLMSFLQRHHGIFYVINKKPRSIVFLKEAFKGSSLIEKCPILQWKERFIEFARTRPSSKSSRELDEKDSDLKELTDDIDEDDLRLSDGEDIDTDYNAGEKGYFGLC